MRFRVSLVILGFLAFSPVARAATRTCTSNQVTVVDTEQVEIINCANQLKQKFFVPKNLLADVVGLDGDSKLRADITVDDKGAIQSLTLSRQPKPLSGGGFWGAVRAGMGDNLPQTRIQIGISNKNRQCQVSYDGITTDPHSGGLTLYSAINPSHVAKTCDKALLTPSILAGNPATELLAPPPPGDSTAGDASGA